MGQNPDPERIDSSFELAEGGTVQITGIRNGQYLVAFGRDTAEAGFVDGLTPQELDDKLESDQYQPLC